MDKRKYALALAGFASIAVARAATDLPKSNEIGEAIMTGVYSGVKAQVVDRDLNKIAPTDHTDLSLHLFNRLYRIDDPTALDDKKDDMEAKIAEANKVDSFDVNRDCVTDSQNPYRLVFAFEGFGGYEPGVVSFLHETGADGVAALMADEDAIERIRANDANPGFLSFDDVEHLKKRILKNRPIDNSLSASSLAWGPVAQVLAPSKDNQWFYFSQDRYSSGVAQAVECAKRLASRSTGVDGAGKKFYPTIVALGFSNGGDAAEMFVKDLGTAGIRVSLAFTIDPVAHDLDIFTADRVLWKTPNVERWVNFYQKADKGSLAGIPIYGNAVEGADVNVQLDVVDNDHDHVYIPITPVVLEQFASELDRVPVSRYDYNFSAETFHEVSDQRALKRIDDIDQKQKKFMGPGRRR